MTSYLTLAEYLWLAEQAMASIAAGEITEADIPTRLPQRIAFN